MTLLLGLKQQADTIRKHWFISRYLFKSIMQGLVASLVLLCQIGQANTLLTDDIGVNIGFSPLLIQNSAPFNTSTLTFIIANNEPSGALTKLDLSNTLPKDLVFTNQPPTISAECGNVNVTPVNSASGGSIRIKGGNIAPGAACLVSVLIQVNTPGTYTNTIPAGTPLTTDGINGPKTSAAIKASLAVDQVLSNAPNVKKAFNPTTIASGQTSSMTITLSHDNILPLTGVTFTDTLPANMSFVSGASPATTCPNGKVKAESGVLSFTEGTLPEGRSCTVTMAVTATATATNTLSQGAVTAAQAGLAPSNATSATLTVSAAAPEGTLNKRFSSTPVNINTPVTMTWEIQNNDTADWTELNIIDTLPAGMVLSIPSNINTTCGGVVAPQSAQSIALTGGTLAKGQSCQVSMSVQATTAKQYTNIITAQATNLAKSLTANATLTVQDPGLLPSLGTVVKTYKQILTAGQLGPYNSSPATVPGGLIQMEVTLNKKTPTNAPNQALTGIKVTDDWKETGGRLQYVSSSTNSCGGNIAVDSSKKGFTLTNGSIAQGKNNCVITLLLKADSSTVTSPVTQTNVAQACVVDTGGACTNTSSNLATAYIVPSPPLYPTVSFSSNNIAFNGTTTAKITIANPAGQMRSNIQVKSILAPGLEVAATPSWSYSCANNTGYSTPSIPPQWTKDADNNTIVAFTIPNLQAFGYNDNTAVPSCTLNFNVVAAAAAVPGTTYTHTIPINNVTSDQSVKNAVAAQASVKINSLLIAPIIIQGFEPILVFQSTANEAIPEDKYKSKLTILIKNENVTANSNYTNLSLTETLPAEVAVAFGSTVKVSNCGSGSATYTVANGVTTLMLSKASIAPNATCQVNVDVISTGRGNHVNTIDSGAITMSEGVSNASPVSATLLSLPNTPLAVLIKDVFQTGSTRSIQGQAVAPGDTLTYQIKIYNSGYLDVKLKQDVIQVLDVVPAGTTLIKAEGSTVNGNTLTWDFRNDPRTIARGESIILTFDVKVNDGVTTPITNIAKTLNFSSCAPYDSANQNCYFDPPNANCQMPANPLQPTAGELANPNVCHPVANPIVPNIKLVKTHTGVFQVNHEGSYVLTMSNRGGEISAGTVLQLADLLPKGMTLVADSITSTQGNISDIVSHEQQINFTFTPHAAIATGGNVTITLKVNIGAEAMGDQVTNYASAALQSPPPTPGPNCSDPNLCSSDTVAIQNVALTLAKTGPSTLSLGGTGTYQLEVQNTGQANTTGALQLVDQLPPGLTLQGNITSDEGTITNTSVTGQIIKFNFTPVTALVNGSKATISIPVFVDLTRALETVTNYAAVGGGGDYRGDPPTPGSNCHDSRCASAQAVLQAGWVLKKTHIGNLEVGKVGNYLLTLTNHSNKAIASPLHLADLLPNGMTLSHDGISSTQGSVTIKKQEGQLIHFDFSPNEPIAPEARVEITVKVDIDAKALGNVINYASVTPSDPPLPPGQDCTFVNLCSSDETVVTAPKLKLSKSGPNTLTFGENASYLLTIKNIGTAKTHGAIQVIDTLPAGLTLNGSITSPEGTITLKNDGSAQNGLLMFDFTPTTDLAGEAQATLSIPVVVALNAPLGEIINYASVGGGGDILGVPPTPGIDCHDENRCANAVTTLVAGLVLKKTHQDNLEVGKVGTYVLTLTNNSNSDISGPLHLADLLPQGITVNGAISSAHGSISAENTVGQQISFDFTPNRPFKVHDKVEILLNVNIAAEAIGKVINYASVSQQGTPPAPGPTCIHPNLCSSDNAEILGKPKLRLVKTGPTIMTLGEKSTYLLTVYNDGEVATGGILQFIDKLPLGFTLAGPITSTAGQISEVKEDVVQTGAHLAFNFTPTANVAAKGHATISIPVTVGLDAALGKVINYASVGGGGDERGDPPTPGSGCANTETRCAQVETEIKAGLSLRKTHIGELEVGKVGIYVLTLTNNSGERIQQSLRLTDLLPEGMRLIATDPITSEQGKLEIIARHEQLVSFEFTPYQPIEVGASVEITIQVDIDTQALGKVINYARVTTEPNPLPAGPGCINNNLCASDDGSVTGQAQLSLSKDGPATMTVGETGAYQLIIKNQGTAPTSGALQLIEKLPAGLNLSDSINSPVGEIQNVVRTGTEQEGLTVTFDFIPTAALSAKTGEASITIPVVIGPSTVAGVITNYASVGGGGDMRDAGRPPTPGRDCKDTRCANVPSTILASNALLSVVKTVNKNEVELGDMLSYTVTVVNIGKNTVLHPVIIDHLPAGFRLINNSSRVSGASLLKIEGAPGATLHYHLDVIAPGTTVTLTYRVRVGVGAMEGDGTNRATAICPRNRNRQCANESRSKVRVTGGVFTTDACIVGTVFVDCNHNALKDKEELGIPGVRLYVEDGTYLISDVEGKYSYCGLSPKTHVLKVDQTTLPQGSQLGITSNRNGGDPNSLFLDLKKGQLHRADFLENTCTPFIVEQVKARRQQGEITAPQKAFSKGFTFESKATKPFAITPPLIKESDRALPAASQGARHGQ
jgi:uncharacterized repeat protein (TIGR01451 family)